MTQLNDSVSKAFQILSLFSAERREISAAILADKLDMNSVTAHRFLRTLEANGALVAAGRGIYRLGYVLADLGQLVGEAANLSSIVQPVLDALTRRVSEACMATMFDGEMVVCIARSVPDRPLFMDVKKGSKLEAYCTANGKLWLADLSPKQLQRYLAKLEDNRSQPFPRKEAAELKAELDEVRRSRIAFNYGERSSEIFALAAPVTSRTGKMVCGLSIFGSPSRFTPDLMSGFHIELGQAASEVKRLLYSSLADGAAAQADQRTERVSRKNA